MCSIRKFVHWLVVLACAGLTLGAGSALADPPSRVARLAYIQGPVSFAPAGEDEWVVAEANRPLIAGDRLYSDADARTELQLGSAAIRMSASTSVTVLNMDDRIAQLQLTEGSVYVNARRLGPGEVIEIDTPNLALSITQPGTYRIDVDANGDSTGVAVRRGQADVYGEGAAYTISAGQSYRFFATGLEQRQYAALPPADAFDQWAASRDQQYDTVPAARYVAPEVIGYQDLDQYGAWNNVPQYGNVWFPTRVAADWAPYRDGRWVWVDPWGWTWVDAQPWGFAPYHYGRWAYVSERWGWVPGPRTVRPVYAPALVAFVGGPNFGVSISAGSAVPVAWFPLGPGEVYRPAYAASRDYFTRVNVTNTVINTTIVNNVYNNNTTNVVYRYRQNPRAVTAVPSNVFTESRLVMQSKLGVASVDMNKLQAAPIVAVPAVAPTRTAVLGAGQRAQHRPSDQVQSREVVAKTRPAAVPAPFETREQALAKQPGRPLEQNAAPAAGQRAEDRRVRLVNESRRPEPAPKGPDTAGPMKGQPPVGEKGGPTPDRQEAAKTREEAAKAAQQAQGQPREQRAQQQEQQKAQQAQRQQQEQQRAQQQEQQRAPQAQGQQQERDRAQQAQRQQQEQQRAQQQEQQKAQQAARQQQEQQKAQQAASQQQEQQKAQQAARQQQEQQKAQQAARQQQEQQKAQQAARQQQEQQKAQQAARQQQEQRAQQQEQQRVQQAQRQQQQQQQQEQQRAQAAARQQQQQEQQKAQQAAHQQQQQEQQRAQREERARQAQQPKGKDKDEDKDKQVKG